MRAQLRHNNNTLVTRAAVLCWEQQQQLSSPLAGTKPCSSAKRSQLKRLQTQKDGYTLATDVQGSHEIQEEVKKTEQSLQRSHGSSAIHDQETGQVHQVVSDLHIVSFTFTLIVLFL